ncbi:MAG: hypothetical protein ACR2RB_15715, partial [Gammaproteobacteria bacterium]
MSASILRHFYKALLWAWISVLGPAPVVAAADSTQKSYGGPFTLVDHTGNTVTDSDFRGEYM